MYVLRTSVDVKNVMKWKWSRRFRDLLLKLFLREREVWLFVSYTSSHQGVYKNISPFPKNRQRFLFRKNCCNSFLCVRESSYVFFHPALHDFSAVNTAC